LTQRAETHRTVDQQDRPIFLDSDRAIVEAVQRIALARGVPMARVAMAWVLKNPVVSAPIACPRSSNPVPRSPGLICGMTSLLRSRRPLPRRRPRDTQRAQPVRARPVPAATGAGQAAGSDGSDGAVRQMT